MAPKHSHLINRSSAIGVLLFSACAMSQTSSADVSALIGSQVKRSEFCTGFNNHHAGFVQYVNAAYPVLADERVAEAALAKLPVPDSPIEVLALTFREMRCVRPVCALAGLNWPKPIVPKPCALRPCRHTTTFCLRTPTQNPARAA